MMGTSISLYPPTKKESKQAVDKEQQCEAVFPNKPLHEGKNTTISGGLSVSSLITDLKTLYISKKDCDITLCVQNSKFKAHKLILAMRSKVFASMTEENDEVIEINDCDSECFEDFLKFVYTGDLTFVSSKIAEELFKTAVKFNFQDLKEKCVEFMTNDLSLSTFCDYVKVAYSSNELDLQVAATHFFFCNIKDIFLTPEWTSLQKEQ